MTFPHFCLEWGDENLVAKINLLLSGGASARLERGQKILVSYRVMDFSVSLAKLLFLGNCNASEGTIGAFRTVVSKMKVCYKIKEVKPNIFAVTIKDTYDLAMTFCRVQEFYESPNKNFRGKQFSIWDYMKWYHKSKYNSGFTYAADWSGFNIPFKVARECYPPYSLENDETPYDEIFKSILNNIQAKYKDQNVMNGYIIGTKMEKGKVFQHEVCHGLFYTDSIYRERVTEIVKSIPKKHFDIMKKNLAGSGYGSHVIIDEIQAYLQHGHDHDQFGKGIDIKILKQYNELFK